MDDQALRKVVMAISANGPYVFYNDQMRQKGSPREVLRMRKATLLSLLGSGYIRIKDSHVYLTNKGHYLIANGKARTASYSQRMRDRGCVRKTIWLHPEDVDKFEAFSATLKGPST